MLFSRQGLDPFVPTLLWLAEHDPDPTVRERCLSVLSYSFKLPAITAAAVPDLTASLKSPNVKVRSQAALLVGELKADGVAAIPDLLRILGEPLDPNVVSVMGPSGTFDPGCAAAYSLGRIAPETAQAKQVIAGLIEVSRSGPKSRRGWAAIALGEFGPAAEEAVPVLIKIISDATPEETFERVASAAQALGKIAPDKPSADRAIAALLPVLQAKTELSRASAIAALGHFGPRAAAAIPRIRELKKRSRLPDVRPRPPKRPSPSDRTGKRGVP